MAYKTILLHLNDARRAGHLLEAAVPLARSMSAHLIGLSVVPPFVVIPTMDGAGASITVDEHREAYRLEMAKVKATFERATAQQTLLPEWRDGDAQFGTVAEVIVDQGHGADLIIASQADTEWSSSHLLEDPVRIVTESGRPLLLIPNNGARTLPPRRVTVAWNGRREAARALFDALPLLMQASDVDVVCLNPGTEKATSGDLPAAEICAALARHGVKCQASVATVPAADVGRDILRQAKAFGSDLLVMGCYGHSRLREFLLGGATRHVLAHMNLPVLMAH